MRPLHISRSTASKLPKNTSAAGAARSAGLASETSPERAAHTRISSHSPVFEAEVPAELQVSPNAPSVLLERTAPTLGRARASHGFRPAHLCRKSGRVEDCRRSDASVKLRPGCLEAIEACQATAQPDCSEGAGDLDPQIWSCLGSPAPRCEDWEDHTESADHNEQDELDELDKLDRLDGLVELDEQEEQEAIEEYGKLKTLKKPRTLKEHLEHGAPVAGDYADRAPEEGAPEACEEDAALPPIDLSAEFEPKRMAAHRYLLLRLARRRVRNAAWAEDAVQDTLLAAYAHRHSFRGRSTVRSWLRGILDHKINDRFREECRYTSADWADSPSEAQEEQLEWSKSCGVHGSPIGEDPLEIYERRQILSKVAEAVEALPTGMREAFRLHVVEERSAEEVAERLGISENNCWIRVHRARKRLVVAGKR